MRMGLAIVALLASTVASQAAEPDFPKAGTPFPQAKALLLKQSLIIGPEKTGDPDARFPEIGCWGEKVQRTCQANYVQKQPNGFGWYVVVLVDPADLRVQEARFAYPIEGLPAIPPPLSPSVPQLKGHIFRKPAINCASSVSSRCQRLA